MKLCHLILALLLAAALPAFANVTLVRSYHLGDLDAGASNDLATAFSREYISSNALQLANSPAYSTDVPIDYPLPNTYSVRFTGANSGNAPVVTNLTDNFGLSAWVKPCSLTGSSAIAYNGHTGSSGWGLYQVDDTFKVLFGGIDNFGSAPVVTNEWTHLALVRDQGTATLYVNGVASGTSTNTPNAPAGLWAIGSSPPSLGGEFFDGWIDEVAVFTFAPGAFNTNDLAYRSPATRQLTPVRDGTNVVITWPALRNDFQLEFSTNLASGLWNTMPYTTNTNSGVFTITQATGDNERFYRLHKPAVNTNAPLVPVIDLMQRTVNTGVITLSKINLTNITVGAQIIFSNVPPATTLNSGAVECEMSSLGILNPRTGTPEAFRYHWVIEYPLLNQYTCVGIHGYRRPVLIVDHQSLAATESGAANNALFHFKLIDDLNPSLSGTLDIYFRVRVINQDLTVTQFTLCQQNSAQCTVPAALPHNDPNDPP